MKLLVSTLALSIGFVLSNAAFAANTFPAFDGWKAAVVAGDQAALAKLYGGPADDEIKFWASRKSAGLTEFDPKVLEIEDVQGGKKLVMRVLGVSSGKHVVADLAQIWVQQPGGWRIATSKHTEFQADSVRVLPQPVRPNSDLYAAPAEGRAELKEALAKAGKEHKRVITVFGGNWCYDCHVLDTTFRSAAFAPLVNKSFVVVHINIGDEGKDNADLGKELGVALDKGVPSLGVLDPDGKVVFAQKNGEFESTVKIGPADVRAFLEKWKPAR
jgi:thioredoxin 1